ncbi:class I SAM-dependent methyltransferase [Maribacter chungangensis]
MLSLKGNMANGKQRPKKPWPTKDAMEQVYAMKLWGSDSSPFYSGEGSHAPNIINPYIGAITSFLGSFDSPLVVCDLGCGDFNVGKELVQHTKKYIAVDIVSELISYNKSVFKIENLEFVCSDIAVDALPKADCVFVRQVLQHLSNAEIQRILPKLNAFKYVILTEHLPLGNFEPNVDIISGQGTRLKKNSGVDLLAPPFHLKVMEEKQLISIRLVTTKSVIVTKLFTLF